jgi:glycosyltransferase involved in cell wall biosynthesis
MQKINVCHVSTLTRWGGVERMLVDFLKHSHNKSLQHMVVSTSSIPEIRDVIRNLGVPFFQPCRRFSHDPQALFEIAKWLKTKDVDIVHSYNVFSNCWGGLSAFLAGVKCLIGGEHGTIWFSKPPLFWLEGLMYRYAKAVIANSAASKKMILKRHKNISAQKVQVIYNAVPFPTNNTTVNTLRQTLGVQPNEFVIGTIGRLDTPKNLSTLLKAARIVFETRNDVRLVIVGDGPLRTALQRQVLELKIADKVVFTGWRQDARQLLRIFDIYVSTSVYESFGNTLVEASFSKKPIIAPRVDGIPEAVEDGNTGLLIKPTVRIDKLSVPEASPLASQVVIDNTIHKPKAVSVDVLASKINYLLDHPNIRQKLGKRGFEKVSKMFSIDRYVLELEEFYQNLMKAEVS